MGMQGDAVRLRITGNLRASIKKMITDADNNMKGTYANWDFWGGRIDALEDVLKEINKEDFE